MAHSSRYLSYRYQSIDTNEFQSIHTSRRSYLQIDTQRPVIHEFCGNHLATGSCATGPDVNKLVENAACTKVAWYRDGYATDRALLRVRKTDREKKNPCMAGRRVLGEIPIRLGYKPSDL